MLLRAVSPRQLTSVTRANGTKGKSAIGSVASTSITSMIERIASLRLFAFAFASYGDASIGSCACADGHVAVAPPISMMNSCRLTSVFSEGRILAVQRRRGARALSDRARRPGGRHRLVSAGRQAPAQRVTPTTPRAIYAVRPARRRCRAVTANPSRSAAWPIQTAAIPFLAGTPNFGQQDRAVPARHPSRAGKGGTVRHAAP